MELSIPAASLVGVLLGGIRATAWLFIAPGFGSWIPPTVRALLAFALVLPAADTLAGQAPPLTTAGLVSAAVLQVGIGAALGFLTYLMFAAVQAAGDFIDITSGYSLSTAFDPLSAASSSVFGRLHQMLAVALLFATNLHLVLLRGFITSFEALPLGARLSLDTLGGLLVDGIGRMFLSAAQIAGPLVAVLFLADVGLALLTRVAPTLNAFSVGFPVKMLVTLLIVGVTVPALPGALERLVDTGNRAVGALLGLT